METRMLNEETDRMPFVCTNEKLFAFLSEVDDLKNKIEAYFAKHPNAKETIFTPDKVKERATQEALSYLNLSEKKGEVNIVPSEFQNPEDRKADEKLLKIASDYRDANLFVREEAQKKGAYLDETLVHKIYSTLFSSTEGVGISRYSFRNSTFPIEPYIVNEVFEPVPNREVPGRMSDLFFMYNNDWWDDHPIVKATKFFLEYYRIQPKMDGNKRTGLLCANFILESNGYPSVFIGDNQKQEFFEAIKKGLLTRDVSDLAYLFATNVQMCQEKIKNDIVSYRMNIRERE